MATVVTNFAKKGGVGKSTVSLGLAAYLATKGHRVLLVDLDHQNSISQLLFGADVIERMPKQNTVAALFDEQRLPEVTEFVHPTTDPNLLIVPANDTLQQYASPTPREEGERQFLLRELVNEVGEDVDYIILDTPPDIGNLLTWNCLMAAHYAIATVVLEATPVQAIPGTFRKLKEAIQFGNPGLTFLGWIANMKDGRRVLHQGYEDEIRGTYGTQIFESVIKRNPDFSDSQHVDNGEGVAPHIYQYRPKAAAAKMMTAVGDELLQRINDNGRRAA